MPHPNPRPATTDQVVIARYYDLMASLRVVALTADVLADRLLSVRQMESEVHYQSMADPYGAVRFREAPRYHAITVGPVILKLHHPYFVEAAAEIPPDKLYGKLRFEAGPQGLARNIERWATQSMDRVEHMFCTTNYELTDATPDLAEAVIGYRTWAVSACRGRYILVPAGNGAKTSPVWDGAKEAEAVCEILGHRAPAPGCMCGLHARYRPAAGNFGVSMSYGVPSEQGATFSDGRMVVGGIVTARGEIEVHSDAFRAQYMKPVAFVMPEFRDSGRYSYHGPGTSWRERRSQWRRYRRYLGQVADYFGIPVVPMEQAEQEASKHGKPIPGTLLPSPPKGDGIRVKLTGGLTLGRLLWKP